MRYPARATDPVTDPVAKEARSTIVEDMTATSRPVPGSHAAVLDSVVRAVAEGRYRMARLHLLWNRDRAPLYEMAELVDSATEMPVMPAGLTVDAVLETTAEVLPAWLGHQVDAEIRRIFARQPVAGYAPDQLMVRIAAAMCIDVSAETAEAAVRVDLADPTLTDERVVADLTDRPVVDAPDGGRKRSRPIHRDRADIIDLNQPEARLN